MEPFVGGASVFAAMRPDTAVLSDINRELIDTYRAVRDFPAEVFSLLNEFQTRHSDEFYYEIRGLYMLSNIEKAARFIYLNRSCWNGLYRVNKMGEFNVPRGTKTKIIYHDDDFLAWSDALRMAQIFCCDFEKVIDSCSEGDFIFADPPYTVNHNVNGFLKYNESMFSWSDQLRLFDSLRRAKSRNVRFMLTNANHDSVINLFSQIVNPVVVDRCSVISGSSAFRRPTTEAIFIFS